MSRRGFTLVEALFGVAILGAGIAAVMSAISSINRTEARLREREIMARLAVEKYEEVTALATTPAASDGGDFTDRGEDRFVWRSETVDTGVTYLTGVRVVVERSDDPERFASVAGVVATLPAPTAAAGGGAAQ